MRFITGTKSQKDAAFKELLKFPFWELVEGLHKAGYHNETARIFRDAAERKRKLEKSDEKRTNSRDS